MKRFLPALCASALCLNSLFSPAWAQNADPAAQGAELYQDVAQDHWARQALNELYDKYQLKLGYPDGSFQGQRPLTRFEMAALLRRLLELKPQAAAEPHLDELKAELKQELEALSSKTAEEINAILDRLDTMESEAMDQHQSLVDQFARQLPFRLSGDLAIRYEHTAPVLTDLNTTISSTPQTRLTLSLDSLETDLPFAYGARLSVGNPRNTVNPWWRLGDFFARIDLAFDRFFISWRPSSFLDLTIGKFRNLYSNSELLMDFDVQPEGAFQRLHFENLTPFLPALSLTLGETIVNMDPLYQANIFILSAKGDSHWQFGPAVSLDLSAGYHHWLKEAQLYSANQIAADNDRPARILGNKQTNTIGTEFGILNGFARLNFNLTENLPLALSADYLYNLRASSKNQGLQAGLSLGQLRKTWDWQLAYFFKYLEADASVAYFVEDQLGGTDLMAHEGQAQLKVWDQTTLFATYQLAHGLSDPNFTRHTLRVGIHQAF